MYDTSKGKKTQRALYESPECCAKNLAMDYLFVGLP